MEQELQQLLESAEFREYHDALQTRPFNLFDVLRNAEYEIRHSNVLAWLLDPDESHGIGNAFLREFVRYLHERADDANVARMPEIFGDEPHRIRVARELDDVDVTIFVEEPANVLVAIENKMEEMSSAHVKQARDYDSKLRRKYADQYCIQSVLLTTSRDGRPSEPDLLYASWFRIHKMVSALLKAGSFGSGAASVFVGQYLDVVDRMLRPLSRQASFEALAARHGSLLTKLVEQQDKGPQQMRREVDAQHAEYGSTIDRLVNDFRQKPSELRSEVRRYLESEGFTMNKMAGQLTGKRRGALWLSFSNTSMDEVNARLNAEGPLEWTMKFMHREVELALYFPWKKRLNEERPILDRLQEFMRDNPIDRRSDRYPLEGRQWLCVYRNPLFTADDLAATPWSRIKAEARERMKHFLANDYRTIEGYLRCLAFDPRHGG